MGVKALPQPKNTDVTVTITIKNESNESVDTATLFNDDTNDEIGSGSSIKITKDEGAQLSVRAEADGYHPQTRDVSFNKDKSITITLLADNPTISYRIEDSDEALIDNADLYIADTLAHTGASGDITVDYNQSDITLCGRSQNYEEGCEQITPDHDQSVTITMHRETVKFTITPQINGEDAIDPKDDYTFDKFDKKTVYKVTVGDSTYTERFDDQVNGGPNGQKIIEGQSFTVNYPQSNQSIDITTRIAYFPERGHTYSETNFVNIAEGSATADLSGDSDVTLSADLVPACSDGYDNNHYDGVDMDDPACSSPDDDVELLKSHGSSGRFGSSTYYGYVSSEDGHEKTNIGGTEFPGDIQYALGEVTAYWQAKTEAGEGGEAFKVEFRCGASDNSQDDINTSEVVPDDGSDGWHDTYVHGITKEFFSSGTHCSYYAVYAGDGSKDGNNDIIFATPEKYGVVSLSWDFPPEDYFEPYYWKNQSKAKGSKRAGSISDLAH